LSESAPLLALDGACIESERVTTEPLNASGGDRRVTLVGYFSPFFRLLRGDARLARGGVRLAGTDARAALNRGEVALASLDAPPLAWTARRYVIERARLALFERRGAERRADAELERASLSPVANLRLCDVDGGVRRRVSLAGAAVTRATTLVVEAPFVDLDAKTEALVANALERLAEDRRLVVSSPAAPLGGPAGELFARADFTVVIARGVVSHAGPAPNS